MFLMRLLIVACGILQLVPTSSALFHCVRFGHLSFSDLLLCYKSF
nr:MAG TPA: hypothetical protein [Caudoviricetes sp.]DAZ30983.1 MAG TPA: hypothetical protein [Caudoviricetes sp.]